MKQPTPPRPMPKWLLAFIQALCVALFVLLCFWAVHSLQSKLAIASLAASAFIAFGFPQADSARPRYIVGGSACGVVCGAVCCIAYHALPLPAENTLVLILFCALAVFFTAFSMIMLNLQHPPANALAASMLLEQNPVRMGLLMMGCILLLCIVKWLVVKWLRPHFPKAS